MQANPDEICEGRNVDAIWKRDEETAVAEILKLSNNKSYLNSVRENEYAKPWRNKLTTSKRVSVPKKVHDLEEIKNPSQTNVDKKRRKQDTSTSQRTAKKQKKEKHTKESAATANNGIGDEDEDQCQSANISSKAAAEKAMAEKFLQRPRGEKENSSNKESSVNNAGNNAGVRRHETSARVEDNDETLEDIPASDMDGDNGSKHERNRKSALEQSPKLKKDCCDCHMEIEKMKECIDDMKDDLVNLKKKMRKLNRRKGQSTAPNSQGEHGQCNDLENECRAMISNSTSLFNTVSILLRKLFTVDEILAHSVSGKAPNSKLVAKPKFDGVRLELLKSLILENHKEATSSQITTKIQAVQKAVNRESKST